VALPFGRLPVTDECLSLEFYPVDAILWGNSGHYLDAHPSLPLSLLLCQDFFLGHYDLGSKLYTHGEGHEHINQRSRGQA
jgi:hypothetical protein